MGMRFGSRIWAQRLNQIQQRCLIPVRQPRQNRKIRTRETNRPSEVLRARVWPQISPWGNLREKFPRRVLRTRPLLLSVRFTLLLTPPALFNLGRETVEEEEQSWEQGWYCLCQTRLRQAGALSPQCASFSVAWQRSWRILHVLHDLEVIKYFLYGTDLIAKRSTHNVYPLSKGVFDIFVLIFLFMGKKTEIQKDESSDLNQDLV